MLLIKKRELPLFPVFDDMWDSLKENKTPIILYGMGNGGDKLIAKLSECGLQITDVCASDEFVRGHSYRGIRVKTIAEIDELYKDYILMISFGSSRVEVMEKFWALRSAKTVIVPDMPIAGDEYFNKEFYNDNYKEILSAYKNLADDWSKHIMACCIEFKLTGDMYYLFDAYNPAEELYGLIDKAPSVAVDVGAYNGDTIRELLSFFRSLEKIYAFEPDKRNYKKLLEYAESCESGTKIVCKNCAAWSESREGIFMSSGNRNSSVSSTASHKKRDESVSLVRIDDVISEKVDFMKFDVEGAEEEALIGCEAIISRDYPTLFISAYHRSSDLFRIQNMLHERYPEYEFYLRRGLSVPAWEITLVAKRKNR